MYERWRGEAGRSFDLGRMSVGDLLRAFASHPAIHAYAALFVLAVAATWHWGGNPVRVVLAVLAAVALYPFVEYGLHRWVLHGRFLYRMPWTAALWKRVHFDHHQDPHRLDVLFGGLSNTLPTIALFTLPLGWAIAGPGGAAAAFAAGLALMAGYELCHAMQHLHVQPRGRYLRRIKRLHLAHHFHEESSNYGITGNLIDRLFGTYDEAPQRRPRSRTTFNLGYDEAEAARYPWVARLTGAPPREGPPRSGRDTARDGARHGVRAPSDASTNDRARDRVHG